MLALKVINYFEKFNGFAKDFKFLQELHFIFDKQITITTILDNCQIDLIQKKLSSLKLQSSLIILKIMCRFFSGAIIYKCICTLYNLILMKLKY